MNKSRTLLAGVALSAVAGLASAQEVGRVISSTPVVQQVPVQQQVCSDAPVVRQGSSGGGAALGALIGAVVGNAISAGSGGGRAAATGLGAVGGAILGDSIEGQQRSVQSAPQCTTQTRYESRTVAYNVTYEYAGRQYTVQMPQDPGPTVRLQITPVGAAAAAPVAAQAPAFEPAPSAVPVIGPTSSAAPVVVSTAMIQPVAAPVYYYAAPAYYYPPVGVSLNLGYAAGRGYRGHGHHGYWR